MEGKSHKALFTASVARHLEAFHTPYMLYLKDKGFEIHTAANGDALQCVDKHYNIAFERSPFKLKNFRCYKLLKAIIERNDYDIIHCHTPVVSVLTRLAARKARKKGTTVIYTAHGFHFFKGAPAIQSRLFRMLEKWLSRYTDHLITINQEDYEAIRRYGFKPGAFYKVPGVGVDTSRFTKQTEENKKESRERYGFNGKAFILIFAAELSSRKNQQMLIKAVGVLKERLPDVLLLLAGDGPLRAEYEQMVSTMGLNENVRLLGFRRDMETLLLCADIAVSSSLQEGLPINIVEAMAVGLPVVATKIRGHADLIKEGKNGFFTEINDAEALANKIMELYQNPATLESMRQSALDNVRPFLLENARCETVKIYDNIIKGKK